MRGKNKTTKIFAAGRYAKNVQCCYLPGPDGVRIHLAMQVTVTVIDIYLVLSRQSNRLCKSSNVEIKCVVLQTLVKMLRPGNCTSAACYTLGAANANLAVNYFIRRPLSLSLIQ